MLIELNQLPQAIRQQILTAEEPLQFVNNGQVVKKFIPETMQTNNKPTPDKSYANGDFSFDLDRMKYMMDTDFVEVPKGVAQDLDTFTSWIKKSVVCKSF